MREVQHLLPFSLALPIREKDKAEQKRRHLLIKGRPRRLKAGSEVIKAAIHPSKVRVIDRIREKMGCTRPEAIRTAVTLFVEANGHLIGTEGKERVPRKAETGRCMYLKIPFDPETIKAIGHQENDELIEKGVTGSLDDPSTIGTETRAHTPAFGLCAVFGLTRQGLINMALDVWIAGYQS